MQAGIDTMWVFAADLFASDAAEEELLAADVAADPDVLRTEWAATVADVLGRATLDVPTDPYERTGGRIGLHTEHLGHVLTEMQWLHRSHAGAAW